MRRISAKRLAALGGRRPSSTLARSGRIKARNAKRQAKNFARAYGSRARVAWVKSQPCVWCVLRGLIRIPAVSDNAHTVGGGGIGMKAGYETIAPLCRRHHEAYDQHRKPFDKPSARYVMTLLAARTKARWQASLSQQDPKNDSRDRG